MERKVIVVSFFGKSQYSSVGYKGNLIDGFPGHRVFHTSLIDDPDVDQELLVRNIIVLCNLNLLQSGVYILWHKFSFCWKKLFTSIYDRTCLSFVPQSDYRILIIIRSHNIINIFYVFKYMWIQMCYT